MLDFICMVLDELWATEHKRKIQNENMCLCRLSGIEPTIPCYLAHCSYHSAIETINDLLLNFLVCFYACINQYVWQCMYEIDFGKMCIGTKGVGEVAVGTVKR